MHATNVRTNRRVRDHRHPRPLTASRSGGIQGLVLVRDTTQAGGWMLKPTKPQAAAYELLEELEAAEAAETED
ncbi:hypothetical protein FHS29_002068 [Saccharothrix tamanrassetensis]|uniref:Uncharacterized protein n=1 Tax=Saccharothrix tamanrassetensis TaxID=1051531 RepID=A0A841CH94_9PSEU|nr:hypothetical protein [Saccharothrix tamanrassetensis]MBB5955487.1 hypothetical protein [Saccharothrix tamanrassetensis]